MRHIVFPLILTAAAASGATLTWDGSSSGNWATGANWSGGTAPTGSAATPDVLVFPATGATKVMSNNLAAGLSFNRLSLTDGYTVSGSGLILRILGTTFPRIDYADVTGEATVNVPISLLSNTTCSAGAGGRLNLGSLSDPAMGGASLTLNAGSGGRIEMDGTTSGTGNIHMNGPGLVVLDASQNTTGNYNLTAGSCTLLTSTIAGDILTSDGTQLSAINANASASVTVAGHLSVALSFDIAGNLSFTGTGLNDDLTLGIGGTGPGSSYDQIDAAGSVTTGAHRLRLNVAGGYPLGTEFKLINKTGAGAINSGTKFAAFAGPTINQDTEVNFGTLRLRFNYAGGDGNDFTATVVPAAVSSAITWDNGPDADIRLSTASNWTTDTAPAAGQVLVFPSSFEKTVLNDGGGNFGGIQFTNPGGYIIQDDVPSAVGKLIMLSGAGISSQTFTECVLATPLSVVADQNWSVNGSGALRIDAAGSVLMEGFNLTLNPTSTGVLNLNAPVSGTGNLNKAGAGLAVIGGTAANTYAGTTAISAGELRLSKPAAVTALTGNITLGGGSGAATLSTTAAEVIADTAVLTMQPNGTLQLGGTETLSGLVYNGGTLNNGANLLALAGNFTVNQSMTLASPLQFNGANRDITVAAGKTLTLSGALGISPAVLGVTHFKKGTGTLIFSGTAPAVTLQADAGVLQMDTTDAVNRPLVALNGGTLQGNGRSRQITSLAGGGTFTPGLSTAPSLWRNTGLAFNSATTLVLDINGTAAGTGFDQLIVQENGAVSLGNAVLQVRDTQVYLPGTSFHIIDNDSTDAVSGTFAGLPAGASVAGAFNRYTISYAGGTGNDVVLTVAAVDSGATRTWDGGGGPNRNWSAAVNWSGDVLPAPGDTLVFPLPALSTAAGPFNDLPAGLIYHRIQFTGSVNNTGNYTIFGNAIGLGGGVENLAEETVAAGLRQIVVGLPITVQPGAVIGNLAAANPRTLVFTQALTTTGGTLRFAGRGGALPQGEITFSGNAAIITGPGRMTAEGNATVDLNGLNTSTWSGGTEIIHGRILDIPHARLPEDFVLTPGSNPVVAGILSGTGPTDMSVNVPANATLNGGHLLCTSLNVAGSASNAGISVNGTADVTGSMSARSGQLNATTLNIGAGASADGGHLNVTTLNNNNGSVSIPGIASIGSVLTVDGTDNFLCTSLLAPGLIKNGGTFTNNSMILSGDLQLLDGSFSIPGGLTFQPIGSTRTMNIATGRSFTTASLGGSVGEPVTINKTGGGSASVTTSLTSVSALNVTAGTFFANAPNGGSVPVTVAGGTLAGSGFVGPVVLSASTPGSTLSPGSGTRRINVASLISSGSGSPPLLIMEINGPATPGTFHDQIMSAGDVSFPPAAQTQLSLLPGGLSLPAPGTAYTLIDKTAAGPISGQLFDGAAPITENYEKTISGVTFRLSYLGGDGNDFTATIINPLTPLQQWRQTHFGTTENAGNAANDFDFDLDGLANLVEFAFGLDPKSAASAALPWATQQGNDMVILFTPPPGVGGITYHGETSTTLLAPSWTPVADTGLAPEKEFRVPMTAPRTFLRIRITEP